MAAPLEGLKVIELARVLAGPWAGQTLSDLGAEVIKVESPSGDDTRQWGPPFVERDEDKSAAYFHSANRGKASVVVDLRTAEGQQKLLGLLEDADILIENFKTGGLAKYGMDYDSLKDKFPKLIYCSITGFGQTGPYTHRAGYDFIIQGISGLMSITGEPDRQPQKHGMAITDIFTGIYSTTAILAAVHQRQTTGVGQHIDMALLDCAVAITGNQAMNYLTTGIAPTRLGNAHPNLTPYEVFETSDGHLIIATGNDGQFQRLCILLGLDDMAHDLDYASNADRVANRPAMNARLEAATRKFTSDDLLQACEDHNVPAGPINSMEDMFNDPQVKARGMQIELDGVPGINSPFKFSNAELAHHRPAPKLGEDD
ncbi:CaiB/BaiF CoA transferase family protein [Sulfitobacter donghicola]|uniref:CoA transferase n=1 Tax=Sulfitobacter donghicola DSW-25 = KCTC 12864 = JCM 14565 TaxID=1300350 RepID=A0A073ILJ2_9RHOB|nr:CaiB/BaiF CoA-transferase family protein [Sulfitobacter donghicola]KEJ90445.1 CoA transferase [Sulfitobacter donghicola DSW-25 = KCTC 12864 = JCM 14565]KIN67677.1 Caib/baif family protein [Sulfitobacter donghicola DSW-25 = KCTC 12864 = JCM 14565]